MSREVVAWRAEDAEHTALQVGRRPVQALWPLLRPNFRYIFLPPHRRAGSGVVAWRWRGAQKPSTPAAADLAVLRRRLSNALQDLSVELDHREGVVAGVGSWELHVTMEKLVGSLMQATDAQLATYAVKTESGWLIRSWGFVTPGAAEIETAEEKAAAETEAAIEPEPEVATNAATAPRRRWVGMLSWSAGAGIVLGGLGMAYQNGWFTPSENHAERSAERGAETRPIDAPAPKPVAKVSTPTPHAASAKGVETGSVGIAGLKPIRADLGISTTAPLSLSYGTPVATQAGSTAEQALAPASIPGATVGGMKGAPETPQENAGPDAAPAGVDEENPETGKGRGAGAQETPPEAGAARKGGGPGARDGGRPETPAQAQAKSPLPNPKTSKSESANQTAKAPETKPADAARAKKTKGEVATTPTAAPKNGEKPSLAQKVTKSASDPGEPITEETKTTVVIRVAEDTEPAPGTASRPAPKEKPSAPHANETNPEKDPTSRAEAQAPAKLSGASVEPDKNPPPEVNPEQPFAPESPLNAGRTEASPPARQTPAKTSSQKVLMEYIEPERVPITEDRRSSAQAPVRGVAGETQSLVYHVGKWQLRRVRDVVLATAPRLLDDATAEAVLAAARAKAWAEARRRVPAIFESPMARSGWHFELAPTARPASWVVSGGGAGVTTAAEHTREVQIHWPDLLPVEDLEARLMGADGRELVRLTISVLERTVRISGSAELIRAVPVFTIQEAESGSVNGQTPASSALAWRSLERSRWSDTRWVMEREGRSLGVRCVPEAEPETTVQGGTLGVVDSVSGWALAVTIRTE